MLFRSANPYTPPATLAQSIMHSSPLLSELVVVREWLHDSAPSPASIDPGATNGYWRFTRNALLQGKRTGRTGAGLVTEMDPDAVNREGVEEKGLAPDDAVSTSAATMYSSHLSSYVASSLWCNRHMRKPSSKHSTLMYARVN